MSSHPHTQAGPVQGAEQERTAGSAPADARPPDVVAARQALSVFRAAVVTDDHDYRNPQGSQAEVRGYVISPRGGGRVAVYWLADGRIVRLTTPVHGPALETIAYRLKSRGWTVEPLLRTSQCVFAHRPDGS